MNKISTLIKMLEKIKKDIGDAPVYVIGDPEKDGSLSNDIRASAIVMEKERSVILVSGYVQDRMIATQNN